MYFVIHNNLTLLRQTNDDTNKVYGKNWPIFTVTNVWKQCLQVEPIFSLDNKLSIQIKYHDKKVAIMKKNMDKSLDPSDKIKQVLH